MSDAWADFLILTLPGVNAQRHSLWRATLAASDVTATDWLALTTKRRQKIAPLPTQAEEQLERRLPQWRAVIRSGGMSEQLWLMGPQDDDWPTSAMNALERTAPHRLTGWGNRALINNPLVAVVGSRDATPEALQITEILSRSLCELGMGVVSGGARGVDQTAQSTALRAGGNTVYALPEGLAVSEYFEECEAMDPERVCLLSSEWPWQRWNAISALARNRVIVALSQAVIVIAAHSTGGSLMTGQTSLDLRRPTLVIDHGEVTVHTAGNRMLIQGGATPMKAEQFLEGHAPSAIREALGLASAPKPETGDLFGEEF